MRSRNTIKCIILLLIIVSATLNGAKAEIFTEVKANDLLKKIENGESISIENARITGEFNVSKTELKTVHITREWWQILYEGYSEDMKIVESEIKIKDSVFENDVDFSNAQFIGILDFQGTSFLGKANFKGVNFSNDVNFNNVHFLGDTYFSYSSFNGDTKFMYANFSGNLDAQYANFSDNVYFRHANIQSWSTFSNVNFFGNVDFMDASFSGRETHFSNTNFNSGANFERTNFSNFYVSFMNANFNYTNFYNVSFLGVYADFRNVNFKSISDFRLSNFVAFALFDEANFSREASFLHSNFNRASFEYTNFDGYVDFEQASFSENADFKFTNFKDNVDFKYTIFKDDADFTSASFGCNALYKFTPLFNWNEIPGNDSDRLKKFLITNHGLNWVKTAKIGKMDENITIFVSTENNSLSLQLRDENGGYGDNKTQVMLFIRDYGWFSDEFIVKNEDDKLNIYYPQRISDFRYSSFNNFAYFNDANFNCSADFSYSSFDNFAYFSNANFWDNANFNYIKFDKVYFSNTIFTNVTMDDIAFNSMKISWSSLKNSLVFDGPTYTQIINNFRDLEQFDDADNAYYQYRLLKQKNKKGLSWLSDEIQRITIGYGIKPWNTIKVSICIILLFTFFYMFTKSESEEDNRILFFFDDLFGRIMRKNKIFANSRFYNKILIIIKMRNIAFFYERIKKIVFLTWWQSWWHCFYISWITFITVNISRPKNNYQRLLFMVEGMLGWIILALFIVTLANVIIRP